MKIGARKDSHALQWRTKVPVAFAVVAAFTCAMAPSAAALHSAAHPAEGDGVVVAPHVTPAPSAAAPAADLPGPSPEPVASSASRAPDAMGDDSVGRAEPLPAAAKRVAGAGAAPGVPFRSAAASAPAGPLPFTGFDDALLALLGVACLAGGYALHRGGRDVERARRNRSAHSPA